MLLHEDRSDDFDPAFLFETASPPCRLCHAPRMIEVFDLGTQAIGSYFPSFPGEDVPSAPLRLMYCPACSLVQLSHGCDHEGIYRSGNYGYRSGQNPQMVSHLQAKAKRLTAMAKLELNDTILDIASNDGTLLRSFSGCLRRVGFDPTAPQWEQYLPPGATFHPELFSAKAYLAQHRPAKLITSLSMLYDLEDPIAFAREVAESLADHGLWHFEQCYLPTMLATTGYDTICHEHLTYFDLATVARILDAVGMGIVDVDLNDTNGGSFAVTAAKNPTVGWSTAPDGGRYPGRTLDLSQSRMASDSPDGQWQNRWDWRREVPPTLVDLFAFRNRSLQHRDDLVTLVDNLRRNGNRVAAIGASTKGNTLLQFCGFGPDQIPEIGEINPQKIGQCTPGTNIPIVPETDVWDADYLVVLPWHFRESIVARHERYLAGGGRLIFPLPGIEIVGAAT